MTRQSTADNLADLVRIYGGEVDGDETTAQLLDMLEQLAPQGTGPSPAELEAAIDAYIESCAGGLTNEDMDEIFRD